MLVVGVERAAVAKRVFKQYTRRFAPMVGAIVVVMTVVANLLAYQLGGLASLALLLGYLYFLFDRMVLFGNGWLRNAVERKLRSLGELIRPEQYRFVGLAHPCHVGTAKRRLIETDDDVGFLRVDWTGIHYRGDSMSFDIPAERVLEVNRVRGLYAPWARIEVVIDGGEPFDRIILDSRNHGSHAACRRDNAQLFKDLRALQLLSANPAQLHLTGAWGEVDEPGSVAAGS